MRKWAKALSEQQVGCDWQQKWRTNSDQIDQIEKASGGVPPDSDVFCSMSGLDPRKQERIRRAALPARLPCRVYRPAAAWRVPEVAIHLGARKACPDCRVVLRSRIARTRAGDTNARFAINMIDPNVIIPRKQQIPK